MEFQLCLLWRFSSSLRDPERGWDRSKVKGLLANLITVRDVSYATALEVVAGGRLYNIVVDTEVSVWVRFFFFVFRFLYPVCDFCLCQVTGKKLLEKGELQRRYTIIPLNTIAAKTLNNKVVNAAKGLVRALNTAIYDPEHSLHRLITSVICVLCPVPFTWQVGENNVHTALSLVGYEADLRKAMEYVFGSMLVCDTLDNARKVAFDKQVMTKTVTLGGDIFDPQGTLSGGESKDNLFEHRNTGSTGFYLFIKCCLNIVHVVTIMTSLPVGWTKPVHTKQYKHSVPVHLVMHLLPSFLFFPQVLVPSQHQFCPVYRSWKMFGIAWMKRRLFFRILSDSWAA